MLFSVRSGFAYRARGLEQTLSLIPSAGLWIARIMTVACGATNRGFKSHRARHRTFEADSDSPNGDSCKLTRSFRNRLTEMLLHIALLARSECANCSDWHEKFQCVPRSFLESSRTLHHRVESQLMPRSDSDHASDLIESLLWK